VPARELTAETIGRIQVTLHRVTQEARATARPGAAGTAIRTPDAARKGIGSQLLKEVVRRSGPGLTLLTFRDVPWNGPWYLRHGFVELPRSAWGPQLRDHWQAEIDAGLHDLGPRLVMHYPGA
jgi:GNAT superfamily N-acetyltransferase